LTHVGTWKKTLGGDGGDGYDLWEKEMINDRLSTVNCQ
jgi:hypothetical protein